MLIRIRAHTGFTLVEMLIAIIIIGVGVAGVMVAYSTSVKGSADALVGKQLVAIAEEMIEEVQVKPYSAPPGSTGAGSTGSQVGCDGAASSAARTAYDEVSDYNGYKTNGVCNIDGEPIQGLADYTVAVVVANNFSLGGIGGTNTVANTLHVTVTVTHGGQSMILDGFKTNY